MTHYKVNDEAERYGKKCLFNYWLLLL